jgi:pseudouridine synthase
MESPRTIVLHKPRNFTCGHTGPGERTIFEFIHDIREPLAPVGRLDKDSEGLLLLSNDGDVINRLMDPCAEWRAVYQVTISGNITPRTFGILTSSPHVDGCATRPAKVRLLNRSAKHGLRLLEFSIPGEPHRQIRPLCEAAGLFVHRLVRTHFKSILLGHLKPGQWRDLTSGETAASAGEPGEHATSARPGREPAPGTCCPPTKAGPASQPPR